MYKSPIDIIYGQMETKLEGTIMKAVQNVHVNVDKEELIRALQYDRGQYKKGYMDAMDKQKWISVKDRLPEKDIRVLVWMKDNEEDYTQMDTDRWSCTMEQGYHWIRWGKSVTHWMPLPEPPKGE